MQSCHGLDLTVFSPGFLHWGGGGGGGGNSARFNSLCCFSVAVSLANRPIVSFPDQQR